MTQLVTGIIMHVFMLHMHYKTHEGLLTVFGKEFILTGKFDKKFGILLNRMEQLRKKADYNCIADISAEEVATIGVPAREYLAEVKRIIKN